MGLHDIAVVAKPGASEEEISSVEVSSEQETFLIFSVRNRRWSIKTTLVQEIMHSAKIHLLPFVPSYIEGVVNCRGLPYTVINILKMEEEPTAEDSLEIEGQTVLVFKRDDDHFALHISNIELFFEPEEEDVKADGIKYKNEIIRFFDADKIEDTLLNDLSSDED